MAQLLFNSAMVIIGISIVSGFLFRKKSPEAAEIVQATQSAGRFGIELLIGLAILVGLALVFKPPF